MINTGLVSISFRNHSPFEIIEACFESGIHFIEWGSDVHARPDDPERLRLIANAQRAADIACCSYGTYFHAGENASEEIYSYIEAARILGARTLRIWCGGKSSSEYRDEERVALFNECKRLAEIAEQEDVVLCTEFHMGTWTDTPESVMALLNEIGSDHFRTYWQPNQHRGFDWNLASSRAVSKNAANIHVFNWKGDKTLPLAMANEEWKAYFESFEGDRYALLEFMPDGRIETLKTEIKSLREILGEKV